MMESQSQVAGQEQQSEAKPAQLSQKDAVLKFALEALNLSAVADGQDVRQAVTKEVRKAIRLKLFEGMKSGSIKLGRPMDDSKLKKYCSSLVNNWFKKDARFKK